MLSNRSVLKKSKAGWKKVTRGDILDTVVGISAEVTVRWRQEWSGKVSHAAIWTSICSRYRKQHGQKLRGRDMLGMFKEAYKEQLIWSKETEKERGKIGLWKDSWGPDYIGHTSASHFLVGDQDRELGFSSTLRENKSSSVFPWVCSVEYPR